MCIKHNSHTNIHTYSQQFGLTLEIGCLFILVTVDFAVSSKALWKETIKASNLQNIQLSQNVYLELLNMFFFFADYISCSYIQSLQYLSAVEKGLNKKKMNEKVWLCILIVCINRFY